MIDLLLNDRLAIEWYYYYLDNWFIVERDPSWDLEIKEDVVEECNKHGGVQHIYVDKASSQVKIKSFEF